jgi:hypothetical protein
LSSEAHDLSPKAHDLSSEAHDLSTKAHDLSSDPDKQSLASTTSAPARPSVWLALTILAGSFEAASFFLVVLILGWATGIINQFLYIYLAELGGGGVLMGVSRFITCAAEVRESVTEGVNQSLRV